MDNTMLLISKSKYLFQQYITMKLNQKNYIGIAPSHGEIILQLKKNKTMKMGELSKYIHRDPSTVTTLVKKLQRLEFVEISHDEMDKRATVINLTPSGEILFTDILDISEQLYNEIYWNIDNKEKEDFRKTLAKVIENLETSIRK